MQDKKKAEKWIKCFFFFILIFIFRACQASSPVTLTLNPAGADRKHTNSPNQDLESGKMGRNGGNWGEHALSARVPCPQARGDRTPCPPSGLSAPGARKVAGLKTVPTLRALALDLRNAPNGTSVARALSALGTSRSLETLLLDLSHSQVQGPGLQSLAALAAAPRLQALHLNLAENAVAAALTHLTDLRRASQLRALTLNLSEVCVCNNVRLAHRKTWVLVLYAMQPADSSQPSVF